jgi:histidinol-phosphate/aromatic aminotransferase/cobyric acid decarboxylase-like protein
VNGLNSMPWGTLEPLDLFNSSLPFPPIWIHANDHITEAFRYADFDLYKELYDHLSSWLGVPPEYIRLSNGCAELIYVITRHWGGPGPVVVCDTTFVLFARAACELGVPLLPVPWEHLENPDLLSSDAKKARIVWIVNPNNPTGLRLDWDSVQRLLETIRGTVVIDESFVEFGNPSLVPHVPKNRRLVVMRSFSKAFGLAGVRVGYCVGHPDRVRKLSQAWDPLSCSALGVRLASRCIADLLPEYELRWADVVRQVADYAQDFSQILAQPRMSGNFLFFRFDNAAVATDFVERARNEAAVLVKPGNNWEFTGDLDNCVRLTIPHPDYHDELRNRLRRLLADIPPTQTNLGRNIPAFRLYSP